MKAGRSRPSSTALWLLRPQNLQTRRNTTRLEKKPQKGPLPQTKPNRSLVQATLCYSWPSASAKNDAQRGRCPPSPAQPELGRTGLQGPAAGGHCLAAHSLYPKTPGLRRHKTTEHATLRTMPPMVAISVLPRTSSCQPTWLSHDCHMRPQLAAQPASSICQPPSVAPHFADQLACSLATQLAGRGRLLAARRLTCRSAGRPM